MRQRVKIDDRSRRHHQIRYHLGRGRRAREAGDFERGAREARRALAYDQGEPWALALLGQCLQRQRVPNLDGARESLVRAVTIQPTNGYFVRLLLEVLDAQGDADARRDLLSWAWWRGAPVERWLPGGPPLPEKRDQAADAVAAERDRRPRTQARPAPGRASAPPRMARPPGSPRVIHVA